MADETYVLIDNGEEKLLEVTFNKRPERMVWRLDEINVKIAVAEDMAKIWKARRDAFNDLNKD